MANDRQQEEIDDYVNGDITEQVEDEVEAKYQERVKRDNGGIGYTAAEEEKIKAELRQQVRAEIIDNMQFRRRFQQERHLDDLQEQERRLDASHYQLTDIQQHDRWWAQKVAMSTEKNIYTEDIGGMHPNEIVDRYAMIAQAFNISDTMTMQKLIDGAQGGAISGTDFKALIGSGEGSELIDSMMQRNNGNINIEELMQTVVDQRIKTAKGYMDVAKADMEARAQGIESKMDLLNKATTTSVQRDAAYYTTLNNSHEQGMARAVESEDRVKRSISLSEIEDAAVGVLASAIDENERTIAKDRDTKEVNLGEE